ncbi:PREDICTED: serine/arginine repetitive matrix protein 1-like isoform X2 [Chinchilla lanigera]|uniref:serine/arginine repetitive matrix protein 1-like isoform X2 n=1 Tax=Chinchilla lanigera TaxID=34839 RepID=UPI00038F1149|nr:PREDICTED: serine/arginine repetitive matrix protein 1-like isoform X2 [Chinchilla lanigera]
MSLTPAQKARLPRPMFTLTSPNAHVTKVSISLKTRPHDPVRHTSAPDVPARLVGRLLLGPARRLSAEQPRPEPGATGTQRQRLRAGGLVAGRRGTQVSLQSLPSAPHGSHRLPPPRPRPAPLGAGGETPPDPHGWGRPTPANNPGLRKPRLPGGPGCDLLRKEPRLSSARLRRAPAPPRAPPRHRPAPPRQVLPSSPVLSPGCRARRHTTRARGADHPPPPQRQDPAGRPLLSPRRRRPTGTRGPKTRQARARHSRGWKRGQERGPAGDAALGVPTGPGTQTKARPPPFPSSRTTWQSHAPVATEACGAETDPQRPSDPAASWRLHTKCKEGVEPCGPRLSTLECQAGLPSRSWASHSLEPWMRADQAGDRCAQGQKSAHHMWSCNQARVHAAHTHTGTRLPMGRSTRLHSFRPRCHNGATRSKMCGQPQDYESVTAPVEGDPASSLPSPDAGPGH